jgi:hypothetical protein
MAQTLHALPLSRASDAPISWQMLSLLDLPLLHPPRVEHEQLLLRLNLGSSPAVLAQRTILSRLIYEQPDMSMAVGCRV